MHTIADKHLTTEQEGIRHLDTAGSIFFKASLHKPQWGVRGEEFREKLEHLVTKVT